MYRGIFNINTKRRNQMKHISIAVLGGDRRFLTLSTQFENDGNTVFSAVTEQISPYDAAEKAEIIILPIPCTSDGISISSPLQKAGIPIDDRLISAMNGKKVFAGMTERLSADIAEKLTPIDYGKREDFLIRNAKATAECAVSVAVNEYPRSLFSSSCIVIGFGRIGKFLTQLLLSFGSRVTVCARRSEHEASAKCIGADYCDIKLLSETIDNQNIIFNTVPAPVIGRDVLERIRQDSLIIDLASGKGGTDFEAADKMKIRTIHALSLPGKYSPDGAAEDIKNTIYSILKEDDRK